MRSAILVTSALLGAALVLPAAAASHECTHTYYSYVGVEAFVCHDDGNGLPHDFIIRDKTLGGVSAQHMLLTHGHSWNGGDFQSASVTVWTYSNTPVGRSWVTAWWWCTDTDGDGWCDQLWAGESTYARTFLNQMDVGYFDGYGWRACVLGSFAWQCHKLPVQPPLDGLPAIPSLAPLLP